MKNRAPIMDQIDVRNYYDEMKSSVIKRSRVHYIADPEEEERLRLEEEREKDAEAEAILSGIGLDEKVELQEEFEPDLSDVDPDVLQTADEIYQRLQREAEEDAKAKQDEWVEKLTRDKENEAAYNKTTGSYSGNYGKGEISQETKDLAANILEEKKLDIDALLEQEGKNE